MGSTGCLLNQACVPLSGNGLTIRNQVLGHRESAGMSGGLGWGYWVQWVTGFVCKGSQNQEQVPLKLKFSKNCPEHKSPDLTSLSLSLSLIFLHNI